MPKPFVKGDPRINRTGLNRFTPEKRIERKAVKELVAQFKQRMSEGLEISADALLEEAKKKNMVAVKEINDRALGKAPQAVDITSGGEKLYNWGNGNSNNIQSKTVGDGATRQPKEVEDSGSSQEVRKDDSVS